MKRRAIIFGIKGHYLSTTEKVLLKKVKPWGIILFERNIKNIEQLRKLIQNIRYVINDKNYPILVDQEGGRVSRINKIIDQKIFSQDFFGRLHTLRDENYFNTSYKIYINTVSQIFNYVGININTSPVLDVRRNHSHKIIGDRSFSTNFKKVSELGKLCIKLYEKNKIATVVKHIPGHGLAKQDSHYKKPTIYASKKELVKKDFKAFKNCNSLFAMTAHVIFASYDKINTATQSEIIIRNIIRKHINFKGILISDDISMKSLDGRIENKALKALKAGCNLVLHCNGKIKEMKKLSKVVPEIDKFTQKKTSHFYRFLR